MIAHHAYLVCNRALSDSYQETQMTASRFTHPFDARSVLLFATIAVGSAMAQAQPARNNAAQQSMGTSASNHRVAQAERTLSPTDPRRHLARQPAKKNL